MNRVIGFLAVMLIFSLPAWAQHPGGGHPGGGGHAAPAHGPEAFHGYAACGAKSELQRCSRPSQCAACPRHLRACAILWAMKTWTGRLVRSLLVLVFLVVNLYIWDWVLLRIRVARGTAFASVQVNQFLATPLKGNKVEYDFMGEGPVTCSRSLFPQQGHPACWWLERHRTQWE